MTNTKKKSVKLMPDSDDSVLPDMIPLVPPPALASGPIKAKKDENHYTTIDIQHEDRFFYQKDNVPHHASTSAQPDRTLPSQPIEPTEKEIDPADDQIESSDQDFNWDDDPDQPKPKRRRTARERFQAAMKRPCCWSYLSPLIKRILIAFFGSCIFIVIAISIRFTLPKPTDEELSNPEFDNVRSNVECWMYWAAFMWHIFWVTTFLLDLVPSIVSLWAKMFKGRRSETVKSYMEYYMSLKRPFSFLLISAWNIGSWAFLINFPFESMKKHDYTFIIMKIFGCILTAAGLYFIQKMIIQYIAFKFHRSAFSERIAENKKSLKILDTLSKSEKKTRPISTMNTSFPKPTHLRKRRSIQKTQDNRYHVLHDDTTPTSNFQQFKKSVVSALLAETPTTTTGRIEKHKMDINSDEFAKKVAKKLFYALAYPEGQQAEPNEKKCLTVFDFIPYFRHHEEASEAFKIFDRDGNGDLSPREFRDTVIYIYRERKGLAQAIQDTSQAMGKIDMILLAITIVITICICLGIFRVDFWTALIPVGTFLAASAFIFESSLTSVFSGIVFQFITHPYDAGDLVWIDSTYMTVKNIGLLGTVFVASDGTRRYAPTSVLMTKIIANIRRSGSMGETLTFNIDFRTENDVILLLREKLLEWIQSQPRDFNPGFDLRVTDIIDMNQVILTCWLPHKGNWVDLGKRFQRKTRFMLALKSILTELDIKYELPAQRITSSPSNNPFVTSPQSFTPVP